MKSTVNLKQFHALQKGLRKLSLKAQQQVLAKGMDEAVKPVVPEAQKLLTDNDAIDTGALRRSMIRRVRVYGKGKRFLGIVGPSIDYYEGGQRIKRARGESKQDYRARNAGRKKPSNYAHLVEFGFVHAEGYAPGKHFWQGTKNTRRRRGTFPERSRMPPRPFLAPAFSSQVPNMERTLGRAVGDAATRAFKEVKNLG